VQTCTRRPAAVRSHRPDWRPTPPRSLR